MKQTLKRTILSALSVCLLAFGSLSEAGAQAKQGAQIKWMSSFDAAKKAAAASGKPLLIDFMASWCGPCHKMDADTFSDPRIQALLQKVVLVRLDVDSRPPQAKTYGVNSIPRVILLPAGGGQPLADIQGYCDADTFAQYLRPALGLSPQDAAPAPKLAQEMTKVREALGANGYAALKAQDPKTAAVGLARLVEALGAVREADFKDMLQSLRPAGDDAIVAFIHGLQHTHLAVRAGCLRALQETLKGSPLPAYDAWAPAGTRKQQAAKWLAWWQKSRRNATP